MLIRKLSCPLIALCGLLVTLEPAHGHHSHASLNKDDVRVFQGIITKYSWRAPHVYIQANVVDSNGKVREYKIEALNPPSMQNLGWSKSTFKPGDPITWQGPHDRDLNRAYAGVEWAETPDGTRLYASAAASRRATIELTRAALESGGIAPVTEVGSGMWYRIAADGSPHPPIRQPSEDWPLTPEYVAKVANWSEDDNPINNCVLGGPPRNIVALLNYKWSRPDENTILIDRDMWPQPRVVHLDPDAPRGEPSSFGHSIGRFEGDELIVETDNFTAETWGMYTGIDSSDRKSLVERYWLSEGGTRLNVEFTVTDPVVLTEPYTYTHQWKRVPDRELAKAPCSIESAWMYKTADYGSDANIPDDARAALGQLPDGSQEPTADAEASYTPWWVLGGLFVAAAAFLAIRRKKLSA